MIQRRVPKEMLDRLLPSAQGAQPGAALKLLSISGESIAFTVVESQWEYGPNVRELHMWVTVEAVAETSFAVLVDKGDLLEWVAGWEKRSG